MRRALVALILAVPLVVPAGLSAQSDFLTTRFERYLDALRKQAGIPGLAGAIVQDDRIVWERAWGYQDLEANIPTSPDTPFYIADLTSTLSATLVLQCIEQGKVRFDQTVSVPPALPTGNGPTFATVYDLLSHSTAGPNSFHYDPARFAALTSVIEGCTQDSLKEAIARRLLQPLAMTRSVPGQDVVTIEPSDFDEEELDAYRSLVRQTAKPYRVDRRGRASLSQYPASTLDAASGLVSTTAGPRELHDRARMRCCCSTKTRLPPHGRRRAPRARSSASAGSSSNTTGSRSCGTSAMRRMRAPLCSSTCLRVTRR